MYIVRKRHLNDYTSSFDLKEKDLFNQTLFGEVDLICRLPFFKTVFQISHKAKNLTCKSSKK